MEAVPNISSRNTCLVLSFRKLTWRNWDPVTGCITQPKWLNNRLCQSLTMTELEQGFLGSLSPTGILAHTTQKRSLLSLSFEITLICIFWENGATWKQRCHQTKCKEMQSIFEMEPWSTSMGWAVWWSPLQGFKETCTSRRETSPDGC